MNDRPNLHDIREFLGHRLEFKQASEPSDIIWENRHFTPNQRRCKAILVWSILVLLLIGSFHFQFIFQKMADIRTAKYPTLDCNLLS